jgi:hypothetical protein
MAKAAASAQKSTGSNRGLGLLDSTMIVAGSTIGSGIFPAPFSGFVKVQQPFSITEE